MATYHWSVPGSNPLTTIGVFGFFDMAIDPTTRDYIDTPDGAWAETEDSRTAVMLQLDCHYGQWFADPNAGSRIREMMMGDPVTSTALVDEVKRALQLLVDDGIIADLEVSIADEDSVRGYLELNISYTDRASGHVVDVAYSPFDLPLAD
jgi:hypothetical protein